MKVRVFLVVAALVAVIALVLRFVPLRDGREQQTILAERLLTALEKTDYEGFEAIADKGLQKLRREDFAALAAQYVERLRGGHSLEFVSAADRNGLTVSEWTIRFPSGSPPARMTLGIREGELATLRLR